MSFSLPELPYNKADFGTKISAETFDYHYGKHHQTYVTALNTLVKGTEWEGKNLDEIVLKYILSYAGLTANSSTMVPNTGTIPSTGTASHPNPLTHQDHSSMPSKLSGDQLTSSSKTSRLRQQETSVQDGPG